MFIRFRRNVFTSLLSSNDRIYSINCSGFHPSCHNALSKIIILPRTPISPKWPRFLRFPARNFQQLSHGCYTHDPSNSPSFNHPNIQVMTFSVKLFSLFFNILYFLGSNIFQAILILKISEYLPFHRLHFLATRCFKTHTFEKAP